MDELDRLLLRQLPTETPGATTPELGRLLSSTGHVLTARAVQKRLAALEARHEVVCDRGTKPFRWSIEAQRKRALLTPVLPHEALTLLLADEHLKHILPPSSRRALQERIDELDQAVQREHGQRSERWRAKVRKVPNEHGRVPPRVDGAVLAAISSALDEELVVTLDYTKRGANGATQRRVHPLGLLERDDALWLVAREELPSGELSEVKQFVLHRMESVTVLRGERAKKPANFSLDRWIRSGQAHFRLGEDVALVARFRRGVADRLAESPIAHDQQLEEVDDDWTRLRAQLPHTRALEVLLIGYGSLCVVEEPAALREAIRGELEAALSAYAP